MTCNTQIAVGVWSFFRCFQRREKNVFSNSRLILKTNFSSQFNFKFKFNFLNLSPSTAVPGTVAIASLSATTAFGSSALARLHAQQKWTSGSFVKRPYLQNKFRQGIPPSFSIRAMSRSSSNLSTKAMDLKDVLRTLNEFAPTSLAESWDNVGLLVEPMPPHCVKTVFLTIDLTEEVLTEAIDKKSDLILAYHPPIFAPLKRLTMRNPKERIIVRAIEKRIAIYSPHTCYDAVSGGVNDWLSEGLGPCNVKPLKTSWKTPDSGWTHKIEFMKPSSINVRRPLDFGTHMSQVTSTPTKDGHQWVCLCNEEDMLTIMGNMEVFPEITKTVQITKLEKFPIPGTGTGRTCELRGAVSIATVVQRIKDQLRLQHVQLALGSQKTQESEVLTVAVCAGSGASVLAGVPADVYLTGEMSHHDILAAVARGTSVILCNHSNTERGYLQVLQAKLGYLLNGPERCVNVVVSEVDADPLNLV